MDMHVGYQKNNLTERLAERSKTASGPFRGIRNSTRPAVLRRTEYHWAMSNSNIDMLRAEIAAAAARLIAEDGADYGTAKRKAAKQIIGNSKVRGEYMPDNEEIETEVRQYNELFFADTQPARLLHLRKVALKIMQELEGFSPYITGAVLNGTAGEHSDIHLQLFVDSAKDVEIFLINKNVDFEVSETTNFRNRSEPVETLSFLWQREGVHLALYETDDLRGAGRQQDGKLVRADAQALRLLIEETENNE
jgi:hypothetical protein